MKTVLLTSVAVTFCLIGGFAFSATGKAVTFSKDVAPIFFNRCTECHRPGEAAPMSLLTYKEARPWAKSIR